MDQQSQFTPPEVCFNWTDVTEEFKRATDELKMGELLHDDMFGLFEAMSAIEMMDPKMDAGMMCNKSNKKVMNFESALKMDKLKMTGLTHEEMIGIIDDTFGCMVTWLEGHSLAQTVFINLYLHNPNMIEDKCLKAFCIIILKLVDVIREFVTKANVFEEEDFQPIVYGYQLACETPDGKACAMIREVEDDTQKRVKNILRAVSDNNKKGDANSDTFSNNNDLQKEQQLVSALYARLKFIRLLFQSLLLLKRESISKFHGKKQSTSINANTTQDICKLLQQCNEILVLWQKTLTLGIQPDASNISGHRADYPTIMGFEPLVNQRLLPPTFPRYTKMKSRSEAVDYLESLINRLRYVCKIYDYTSYQSALEFFNDFSKSTPSCVLSRSLLQVLYLPQPNTVFGVTPMTDLIKEAIKAFIKPPSLYSKSSVINNNPQAKEVLDTFLMHCTRPMATLTQICGHNRARQREKLSQILEELSALQDESEKLDAFFNNLMQKTEPQCSHFGYYCSWVVYHIFRVKIQYILSGFELELYATHEYPYIFWYLHEWLFNWIVTTLNRASNFIMEQENFAEQIQQQQKGRTNKKVKAKKRKQRPHHHEILLYQALQHLSNGYYKTLCGFKIEGKLKMPSTGLNTEQIRYEHRFAPFRNFVAPPPVSYAQYKDMTSNRYLQQNPNELYIMACKCFQQAKSLLEEINDPNEEIIAYLKIAKTNLIVMKVLLSGHTADSKSFPDFEFSIHKNFPIIRIYKKIVK